MARAVISRVNSLLMKTLRRCLLLKVVPVTRRWCSAAHKYGDKSRRNDWVRVSGEKSDGQCPRPALKGRGGPEKARAGRDLAGAVGPGQLRAARPLPP